MPRGKHALPAEAHAFLLCAEAEADGNAMSATTFLQTESPR